MSPDIRKVGNVLLRKLATNHEARADAGGPGGAPAGRVPKAQDAYSDVLDDLLEPGARDVRDRLLENGATLGLTAAVVRSVLKSRVRGAFAIDAAARVLGSAFPILPSPKRKKGSNETHLFAFVGPTGAGKTTTLAKLARRLLSNGRRVLLASMDAAGTSALERVGGLTADVDRVEVPLVAVRGAADLAKELRRHGPVDVVLLDTPGLSPRDEPELEALAREIDRVGGQGPLDVLLVLPATNSRNATELVGRAFARTAPVGCVLTKLDETDTPLVVLEEVARANLPIAFLCDGIDTRGNLSRPTQSRLADLALRGRVG